jgi:hypothetical protein
LMQLDHLCPKRPLMSASPATQFYWQQLEGEKQLGLRIGLGTSCRISWVACSQQQCQDCSQAHSLAG